MTASATSTEAPAPVNPAVVVGDFYYSSWGYDQTNVDFYRVVGVTASGKSARLQKWISRVVKDYGSAVYVVPGEFPETGAWVNAEDGAGQVYDPSVPAPVKLHRAQYYRGEPSFTLNSYSSAYKWEGQPVYQTGSGFGH